MERPPNIPKSRPETLERPRAEVPPLTIDTRAPELNAEASAVLNEQWQKFWELRAQQVEGKETVETAVKAGYLTHHSWNTEHIDNILKAGILSGELGFGEKETVAEDAETHYCADFFVSDTDRTIPEYVEFTGERQQVGMLRKSRGESFARPTGDNERIAFVIDPSQQGLDAMLKRSGTGIDKEELDDFPVRFPHEKGNHLAVLVGIPANYISFIVVGGKVEKDSAKLEEIRAAIKEAGLEIPLVSTSGERI